MRAWYLRRAIPWVALLGSCAGAVAAFALVVRWPSQGAILLPVMLGCCAAAAGFVFDEPVPEPAAVTPRGAGWRRTTRLTAVAVPLALWGLLVAARPDDLPLSRASWWLAGAAATVLVAGLAAVAARWGVRAPGASLAALVALAVFVPLVLAILLGWTSVYPVDAAPAGVTAFWSALGLAGVGLCATALRPGLRP